MRTRIKNLSCCKLGAIETSIYTPGIDRSATIKSILLTNTYTAAVTVRIGIFTNAYDFIAVAPLDMSIAAGDTAYLETPFTMPEFAQLHAYAAQADKIDCVVSGFEELDAQAMYPELYLYNSTSATYHQITLGSDLQFSVGTSATPTTGNSAAVIYVEGDDGFIYPVSLSGTTPQITIGNPVCNTTAVQGVWLYSSAFDQYVLLKVSGGALECVFAGENIAVADYDDYRLSMAVMNQEASPGTFADEIIAASFPGIEHVIIMPSGAGSSVNPDWETLIDTLQASGMKAYCTIDTAYTTRALADVYAEIATLKTLYPRIMGIYFKNVDITEAALPYYQVLWMRANTIFNFRVIIGAGADVVEGFMQCCNVLVSFEGTMTAYNSYAAPAWTLNYEPRQFIHLVHTSGPSDYAAIVARARYLGCANIFCSNQTDWLTAPTYWSNLRTEIEGYRGAYTPLEVPGCINWYAASACMYDGSNLVSAVTDQSISAQNLAQGNPTYQPAYVASGVNSKPVIRFAGTQNVYNASVAATLPFTVVAIFKASALDDGRIFGATTDTVGAYVNAGGYSVLFNDNTKTVVGTVSCGTDWKIGIFIFHASAYYNKQIINDVVASTAASGTNNFAQLAMGATYGGTNNFTGDIFALGIWDRVLGSDECTEIYDWAADQLNI